MRRTESRWLLAAAMAAVLIVGTPADACTVSATGVMFGAYDPRATGPDDGTGAIDIACHPSDQSVNIALSTGSSGSFSARRMSSGAAQLDYNLYTGTSRTVVWGDGSGGTSTVTLTEGNVSGGRRRFSADIFGRIPALQNVPAGSYVDTIVVTVTF
ncbi:MAG: Csu type fimbrial protein [Sphingosinicella sp.]|uniref:Csu type fimbrial protein n=1 Tax=Sphingosinicella sp. TaxID=1917971 RepID=UPI004037D5BE